MPTAVLTTVEEFQAALAARQPVFVPTLGALHAGHAALIRNARSTAGEKGCVAVSIFVNPTQFAANEDLSRYPRQLEKDIATCEEAGANAIFAPSVSEMYPAGLEKVSDTFSMPPLPEVATSPQLEDRFRPTHFAGVCKVVARLFDIAQPSHAIFGEKDFQQLRVITEMTREQNTATAPGGNPVPRTSSISLPHSSHPRWPNLQIIAHPTIRERDGLAMSSRNVYLSTEQRKTALALWRAISEAKREKTPAAAEDVMRVLLDESGFDIDYAVVRDAVTLLPVEKYDRPCRALIAARIGSVGGTRLIDNMAIGPALSSHSTA